MNRLGARHYRARRTSWVFIASVGVDTLLIALSALALRMYNRRLVLAVPSSKSAPK
jgi:hypothetical protein